MNKLLNRFLPLPIAAYLVGFITLALLLFTLIGGWMLMQMNKVTTAAEASRQQSAEQEMEAAVHTVYNTSRAIADELAEWDETRQQLQDSTYYEYWRNTRVHQSGHTPPFVTDVDIYNTGGEILLDRPSSPLPTSLPDSKHFMRMEKGGPYFYQFTPLTESGSLNSPAGYIGIRLDFKQALLALNRFIHVDIDSFEFLAQDFSRFPAEDILLHMRFTPRNIGETSELESVMVTTLYSSAAVAVLLMVISYFLTSFLLHAPLRNLAQHIENLRRGNADINMIERQGGSLCVSEFDVLRSSIVNYQTELEEMHTHLDQKNKELWRLAHHDALTGVANRRAYDEDWMRLQELVRGQRITLSVMLIDCDHFKAINDTYGHDVGDQVIRTIADSLKQSLRDGDHIYRLGGDEFAVHLVNTETEHCRRLALQFQEQLKQFDFKTLGIKEPVRTSIGIASAEGSRPQEIALLHKQADIAMYQAKRPNSNKIIVYHDSMAGNGEILFSNRFINAVYQAIESGKGIELHYQPVVSAYGASLGFHEILVRLRDEQGIIMPAGIFPVIESEGLAVEFDYAIFNQVAQALEQEIIPAGACISLNIDGCTLMHQDFIQRISELKTFINPGSRRIVLEITENALISEIEEGSRKLKYLREVGFTIALDDFGSGYSSLRYLANMPVDLIKLDIGMVRDLEGNPTQQVITEHIVYMVRDAGYQLVAEGIETEGLLQRVIDLGFTHAQGFLFDHALAKIDTRKSLTVEDYPRDTARQSIHKALGL